MVYTVASMAHVIRVRAGPGNFEIGIPRALARELHLVKGQYLVIWPNYLGGFTVYPLGDYLRARERLRDTPAPADPRA